MVLATGETISQFVKIYMLNIFIVKNMLEISQEYVFDIINIHYLGIHKLNKKLVNYITNKQVRGYLFQDKLAY